MEHVAIDYVGRRIDLVKIWSSCCLTLTYVLFPDYSKIDGSWKLYMD